MRSATLLLLAALACGLSVRAAAPPAATAPAATARAEAPDPAALAKAARLVEEIYGDDLAKAVKPEDKLALAKKLMAAGIETAGDVAARYALLVKARDLAVAAGEPALALDAVAAAGNCFPADPLKAQADLLVGFVPRPLKNLAAMFDSCSRVTDQAVAADRYDLARQVAEAAAAFSRRLGDPATMRQMTARLVEVREIEAAHAKARAAFARLEEDPADVPANLAAGRFLCFYKGDWPAGLPKLAVGAEGALKELAAKEPGVGDAAEAKLALADGWWALAERETQPAKKHLQLHAAQWYQAAAPGLSGLSRAKAQRRVEEAQAGGAGVAPAPQARRTTRIKVINRTDAKEAEELIDEMAGRYPEVAKGLREVALVKYHDGTEYKRGAAKLDGAYSPGPIAFGGGGITLSGIYEDLPAGRYLIIYRLLSKAEIAGEKICFLDVCRGGGTIAARHPDGSEFAPDKWINMPIPLELKGKTNVEYRLWAQGHNLALDRVYVFLLP